MRFMPSPQVFLSERASDVERWFRGELPSEVVKRNDARTVWRAGSEAPRLYVKRFPPSLFRDRATAEARMLQTLAQAGIPCPRLVATSRDSSGSYVITEEVPDAPVLRELLDRGGPGSPGLVTSLGRLVRRIQDAGIDHQDLHVGNVLARGGTLYVIDVHRASKRRFSDSRRIAGLAFTAMSFLDLRPLSDVARFLRAAGLSDHRDWERVWMLLRRDLHRYYAGRGERCVKSGLGFGVHEGVFHRTEIDVAKIVRAVSSGPLEPVKVEGTRGFYRSPEGFFVKRMNRSSAVRYWRAAHELAVRKLGTPRLFACGSSWVAGEWLDSPDLHIFVRDEFGRLRRQERDALLRKFAREVCRLHLLGVRHKDLKAGNVLVRAGEFLFVDLDSVRFQVQVDERHRILNLAQLNASVTPPLTRTDRLRFLRAYFGFCASLRKEERRWAGEIMRVTVARRHRWPPRKESS
jgi:tRNA A-37 threonylcarbamoyl transferase component Bud32